MTLSVQKWRERFANRSGILFKSLFVDDTDAGHEMCMYMELKPVALSQNSAMSGTKSNI